MPVLGQIKWQVSWQCNLPVLYHRIKRIISYKMHYAILYDQLECTISLIMHDVSTDGSGEVKYFFYNALCQYPVVSLREIFPLWCIMQIFFGVWIPIFWWISTPCKISEPKDNPFLTIMCDQLKGNISYSMHC